MSETEEGRNPAGIQVIARAAAIMRSLGGDTASLGSLAKRTGLARSTVQRIVDALAAERLLEAGEAGVRLGWGLKELGDCVSSQHVAQLRGPLQRLFEQTRETVDIAVLHGREVTFLDRIVSDQEVRVVPIVDRPFPPYAMANGKAILACHSEEAIAKSWPLALPALTGRTLASRAALLEDLHTVRSTGFAFDREEHAQGVCALGAALNVPGVPVYAVSVVVPAFRFEASLPALKAALQQCRDECMAILLRH